MFAYEFDTIFHKIEVICRFYFKLENNPQLEIG